LAAAASDMAARSRPSGITMSPLAEVTAQKVPRVGVQLYLTASQPGLASSVTSNLSRFQGASAEVIAAAAPGLPCQASSARSAPGAAGWSTQGRLTGTPRTPATAHSMCGHTAGGAQCTCSTPRTDTQTSLQPTRYVFPNDLAAQAGVHRQASFCLHSLCRTCCGDTSTGGVSRGAAPQRATREPPLFGPIIWCCHGYVHLAPKSARGPSARDVSGLLFVAEMYGLQLDQLAAFLQVSRAGASATVSRWLASGYADSGRLGPGPRWVWLTKSGLAACGLPYSAAPPALARLAHLRAVTSVRLALAGTDWYTSAAAHWRSERRLRYRLGGRVGGRQHLPDGEVHWPDDAGVPWAGECWAIEAELTPKTVARTAAIMRELLTRTGDYGCQAGAVRVPGQPPRHTRALYVCAPAAAGTVTRAAAALGSTAYRIEIRTLPASARMEAASARGQR
jgi:hypothetical protein